MAALDVCNCAVVTVTIWVPPVAGGVYKPPDVIVPRVPSPPTTPSTDHTKFPPVPPTTLNCWLSVGVRTDTLGAIEKPAPSPLNDTTLPRPSSSHAPRSPPLALNQSTSACPSPLKSPTPTTCHGGEHPAPQVRERMEVAMTLPWPFSSHTPSPPVFALNQSTSACPSPLKSPTPTTCHGGEHPEPQVMERMGVDMTLPWPSSSHSPSSPVFVLDQNTS